MRLLRSLSIATLSLSFVMRVPAAFSESKTPSEWFESAASRMDIRSLGSTPFHMHVTFHAFAGLELLSGHEKSDFVAGDGVYDEIWFNPHKWRREVRLADYHTVEVESGGKRVMQTTSDYEPSRIYMLLDALLTPIPSTLTSREFHDLPDWKGWKVHPVTAGGLSLVRLSKEMGTQRGDFTTSYYFFPGTEALAMKNSFGLVTIWADDAVFANKIAPRSLTIRCSDRDLLTASISLDRAAPDDAEGFILPGPPAEPGMTLRPLHSYEIHVPDVGPSFGIGSSPSGYGPFFVILGQVDRHGRYRELELLLAPSPTWAATIMDHFRGVQFKSPTIDGSPCQFQKVWRVM